MVITASERQALRLMTPGEVAALFRVDPKTVTRWRKAGRISGIVTPGGHIRFRKEVVYALLAGATPEEATATQSAVVQCDHIWRPRGDGLIACELCEEHE